MGAPTKAQSDGQEAKHLIFVVDDQPMLLEFAAAVLAPLGHEISTFRDPEAALQSYTAANPRPALLITDYAMGGTLNGLDLIRECRLLEPRQKVIMFSGTVDETIFAASPVKPDHFLPKPYAPDKFLNLVRSTLSNVG